MMGNEGIAGELPDRQWAPLGCRKINSHSHAVVPYTTAASGHRVGILFHPQAILERDVPWETGEQATLKVEGGTTVRRFSV